MTTQDLMRAYDAAVKDGESLDAFPHLKGKTRQDIEAASIKYESILKHNATV